MRAPWSVPLRCRTCGAPLPRVSATTFNYCPVCPAVIQPPPPPPGAPAPSRYVSDRYDGLLSPALAPRAD